MLGDVFPGSYKVARALLTRKIYMENDRIPLRFEHVPLKKIFNWVCVESSIFVKPEKPWGWPTHLQIEPTTLCNLRCAVCPVTEGLRRPTGHMELSLFKKLIDEVGKYALLVLFWDWGEPFLNPAIYEMIAYAKEWGIKTVSSTNGHLFAREDHAEKLVRSGLDAIIFAVDGISQETYQQYRQGGDLDTVIEGLRKVVASRRALRAKTPFINFRFMVTGDNQHEVQGLRDFSRSLEIDMLSIKTLNPHANLLTQDGEGFVPDTCDYNRFEYDPVTHQRIRSKVNPCKAAWNICSVHWDGTVCPCTYDAYAGNALGDLKQTSFKDIWWGEPYRAFRRRFHQNYRDVSLCSECSFGFKGGDLDRRVPEAHFFEAPPSQTKLP